MRRGGVDLPGYHTGMDEEREYVRAMFALFQRMVEEEQELERDLGIPGGGDDRESVLLERRRAYVGELQELQPPSSLREFHREYVTFSRQGIEQPRPRTEQSGRLIMPEGQYERAERGMELPRVLMAVATDEDMAAGGLPPEGRWQFVAGDEADQPREQLVMVDKEGPDWREKLRAEMERRGIPERDIEEAMRRIEGMRDEG